MDTTMFHDDCAYLPEWPGVPIGDEEGRIIHEALGKNRAILLAHHGQLVACATMEEAAVLAVFIERAARMQVLARAIGADQGDRSRAREGSARLPAQGQGGRRHLPLLRAPRAEGAGQEALA